MAEVAEVNYIYIAKLDPPLFTTALLRPVSSK